MPIKSISKNINKDLIIRKVKTINSCLKNLNKSPKIAILGLNPHNSEMIRGSRKQK